MKDTIDMAREAGFVENAGNVYGDHITLKAFEALVLEACAKVCESIELDGYPTIDQQPCAAAIRARAST
jgi:hypothetical protein